ncbi:PcsB-like coiled-coil domain-containing protein [Blautia sp. OF11-22]|jgi:peptidoglycan hydrolase CwlO-like protein|uniref:PcsB-like coiled-coil domain-containing protein n=1 Tax=Blautia sp. OF11-22 TaxID=2292982 RepID=UPI000E5C753A|nr:hypothetical protein [Blautia sp. OF11-22]RHV80271.1 hypothetical protein DXB02_06370 [Blautia sp. OF11-22]
MKKKKLFSLVLATVLTAATVLPCYGASTKEKISNAQAEQAAAQSQLDSIQSRIDELNSKKGQSEEYLSELNQQLDDLQNRLQELQDQYDAKQNELVQIQADLEDAKAKEEEQYEAMKLRIQYMYENSSGNGYMAMLFSSKSISELISRAEYIQKISDFDRDLMQEYEDTVDQVKEKETQVQEEQAAIVELQQQSSDQQEAIQELYAAAYQELRTYSAELDDAKSSESALVDEINSKADAINDLIRQAKEEEIAAQKKAEEEAAAEAEAEAARKQAAEAARVAAAEAANAAAKADTDTSSSSGSSSSDSSASSTTTGSPSASDTSSSSSSGTYLGRFKLTGYCSCSICTGQWSGGSTASGTTPTAGRTIAMGGVPFGTKLMINGQVYTVEDRGTAYGHVDIFCSSHSEALSFGVQYADVYQLS